MALHGLLRIQLNVYTLLSTVGILLNIMIRRFNFIGFIFFYRLMILFKKFIVSIFIWVWTIFFFLFFFLNFVWIFYNLIEFWRITSYIPLFKIIVFIIIFELWINLLISLLCLSKMCCLLKWILLYVLLTTVVNHWV